LRNRQKLENLRMHRRRLAAWFVVIEYRLHMRSGSLVVLAAADAIGLVQKELPVT
jgi:hypothetical protein